MMEEKDFCDFVRQIDDLIRTLEEEKHNDLALRSCILSVEGQNESLEDIEESYDKKISNLKKIRERFFKKFSEFVSKLKKIIEGEYGKWFISLAEKGILLTDEILFEDCINSDVKEDVISVLEKRTEEIENKIFPKLDAFSTIGLGFSKEIKACYKYKYYRACALLLFSLIDRKFSYTSDSSFNRFVKCVDKYALDLDDFEDFSLVFSYAKLICRQFYYSSISFNDIEGRKDICFNRNWVIHGKGDKCVSKIDCLLLMVLVYHLYNDNQDGIKILHSRYKEYVEKKDMIVKK